MVDLRQKAVLSDLDLNHDGGIPDAALTAPSPDLMARLRHHFAIYLPKSAPAGVVADEIAEQRGAWMVITFLQSIIDAQENRP